MPARRTVTVLFTDLVGSSDLLSILGHDAAQCVRRTHFSLLREAIKTTGGEEVKSLGDGIMAVFDSVASGLACAVAMQRAVARHNRQPRSHQVAVRIGLSVGDAEWEAGDVFGVSVVEASRLCDFAEGGQILAAERVRAVDADRSGHRFRAVGDLTLKGLAGPLPVVDVDWEQPELSPIPLPGRLQVAAPLSFAGRAGERQTLSAAWQVATAGERRMVVIGGEPGIGKTRLAMEVAAAAHREGATVLHGHCDEELGVPYEPFTAALRHYVAHCPAEELITHVAAHGGVLGRLVPQLGRRVPHLPPSPALEPDTERYQLFEAVTSLLAVATEARPLVLVLDDLHWAGKPALLLLRHLLATEEPMAALVIGAYRSTEISRSDPLADLLADLHRDSGVERISLDGLTTDAVGSLVDTITAGDLQEEGSALARAVAKETEGNPLYVVEMLRHLTESGALAREAGRWTFRGELENLGVPETIRELITRRLRQLPAEIVDALEVAAAIGREFDMAVLELATDISEEAVSEALERATATALVTEVPGAPGRFSFSHVLIRNVLYGQLGPARRKGLHRRIAEAIEAATGEIAVDELAHHWLQATPAPDKAFDYSRRAGEQALSGLAYEEAAVHFGRALGVLERRSTHARLEKIDVLLRMGDAWRRAGDRRYREVTARAATLARDLGAAELLARAALGSSRPGSWYTGIGQTDEALIALFDEAIVALGEVDTALRSCLLAQLAVELYWTPERKRRVSLSDEALTLARKLDDPATLAQVLAARVIALWAPDTLQERLVLTAELGALAARLDNPEGGFLSRLIRAISLFECGDLAAADNELPAAAGLAAQLRQPFYAWLLRTVDAMRALMTRSPEAETAVYDAFYVGQRSSQADAPAVFSSQIGMLRWDQGRFAEVVDVMASYVESMPKIPAWRGALAIAYAESGRMAEARAEFEILAQSNFELPADWVWMSGIATTAEVCAILGDGPRAEILYPMLLPVADRLVIVGNGVVCMGSASRLLGLLAATFGDRDLAAGHFEHALDLNARAGARNFLVRTHRNYAAMLLDRGDDGDEERAKELIATGLAMAEELGMPLEAERLRNLGRQDS